MKEITIVQAHPVCLMQLQAGGDKLVLHSPSWPFSPRLHPANRLLKSRQDANAKPLLVVILHITLPTPIKPVRAIPAGLNRLCTLPATTPYR
ncbi:hypothetical protein [Novosphingobium sp. CECT 9465]|uniref:hypothetical protein n=1 Tax=Novosphingobium sp. CECT 9465 TaxID=2829794 RepID=UPI001E2E875B|nr:hypothetical protein [Novosphingobium sp. CECT 9465]